MMLDESLPEYMTYAIGDIHGSLSVLQRLLAGLPYRDTDTLVFLGDYMDRGADVVGVIRCLRALAIEHRRCVFLRGNHEDAWLYNWNGARFRRPPDMDGADDLWDAYDGNIPFEVGFFLEETQIEYEDAYAYYVHAGLRPGKTAAQTPELIKLWGIAGFLQSQHDWGKPIVVGHWSLKKPLLQPNKICVDTGAHKTGILTAVRLPDRTIFQTTPKKDGGA